MVVVVLGQMRVGGASKKGCAGLSVWNDALKLVDTTLFCRDRRNHIGERVVPSDAPHTILHRGLALHTGSGTQISDAKTSQKARGKRPGNKQHEPHRAAIANWDHTKL
jgi:hypothetical protein